MANRINIMYQPKSRDWSEICKKYGFAFCCFRYSAIGCLLIVVQVQLKKASDVERLVTAQLDESDKNKRDKKQFERQDIAKEKRSPIYIDICSKNQFGICTHI